MIVRGALGGRRQIGWGLGTARQRAAAAGGWWLLGGIPAENCLAAYQPVGAASYAASLVNLANPGTYDLLPVSGDPDWYSSIGWIFSISGTLLYFNATVTNPSVIIKINSRIGNTNVNNGWLFGSHGFTRWAIRSTYNDESSYGYQTTTFTDDKELNRGVVAMTKDAAYWNGVLEVTINKAISGWTRDWGVGGNTANNYGYSHTIQALAVYNNYTLSQAQVQVVGAEMAKLNWWTAGGLIPEENVVCAYQAKDARSYDDSKVNLANPGTLDAQDGATLMSWSETGGWRGYGISGYLVVDYVVPNDQSHSAFVSYTNYASPNRTPFMSRKTAGSNDWGIFKHSYYGAYFLAGGNVSTTTPYKTHGVDGIAGNKIFEGVNKHATLIPAGSGTNDLDLFIGAMNNGGSPAFFWKGNIESFVLFDIVLTDAQAIALSQAMKAL